MNNLADIVVAEVTDPSHGVGIELGWAILRKIPILCISFNSEFKISALIRGCSQIKHK